ncbi:hypothetical protein Ciccas_012193 [Cichlidogyrus casuarinus]|uniref:Uncharacterized protein n=1 Tax=Cichlidogyrus casuarinus TaxID=1844966 RepID=A0ABD2PPJ7_9PLAT
MGDFVQQFTSPSAGWNFVINQVEEFRRSNGLQELIRGGQVNGWRMFGLNHRHVAFMVEQMPGAAQCHRHDFLYHWKRVKTIRELCPAPMTLVEGAARLKPWPKKSRKKHEADPLDFLRCQANPPPMVKARSKEKMPSSPHKAVLTPKQRLKNVVQSYEAAWKAASGLSLATTHSRQQFERVVLTAVSQAMAIPVDVVRQVLLRPHDPTPLLELHGQDVEEERREQLEQEEDEEEETETDEQEISVLKRLVSGEMARLTNISVHPSNIHGRGLYALKSFRKDEFIVEYTGELIRNGVCEARELRYRAQGVDCYMFRVDTHTVIDATYKGNAARFINHSCDPNCYSKVVEKKIIICALRKISPGEELTYDYRFPRENDKLLCNCGADNCRRYLN